MSATDPHDTPPGLLAGLGQAVLRAIEPFDSEPMLGVPDAAKPAVIAALAARHRGSVLVLTPTPANAADLVDALPLWLQGGDRERLRQYPARETAPYERQRPAPDVIEARLSAIEALRGGSPIVVCDVDAAAQRTIAAASPPMTIGRGSMIRLAEFVRSLDASGYERNRIVIEPASFAVRGGIVDFWPPADDEPVRVELFGDEVDSIRRFDPRTQRSTDVVEEIGLRPAREWSPGPGSQPLIEALLHAVDGRACEGREVELNAEAEVLALDLGHLRNAGPTSRPDFWTQFLGPSVLFDHLPPDALIIVDEPHDVASRSEERDERAVHAREELERGGRVPPGLPHPWLTCDELEAHLRRSSSQARSLSRLASGEKRLPFRPAPRLAGKLTQLFESLRQTRGEGAHVLISLQEARLSELMTDLGLPLARLEPEAPPDPRSISVGRAAIGEGWQLDDPDSGERLVTLISDTEIFGFERQRQRRPLKPRAVAESDPHLLETLKPGDFVVHVDSGIGKFHGVARERIGGREGEYLDLRFAKGDRLLVPTDKLDRVQPYVGPSDAPPTLTRLGGGQWQRAKARVRGAVAEIADELLELHAARETEPGIAIEPDTPWQIELEASFPYIETPDQHRAIEEVRRDQEAPRPMDRLIVGDVGYGKTEVAIRAAFKAVMSGHQVAVLVPTTVLAQQHYDTFRQRLAAMQVEIGLLSRLRTSAEQQVTLDGLKAGSTDIVIGTHRLLQGDIGFKSLGLLIIDEEQRFGVEHKERLKKLRREVDVLTLSATPIPRSLHQAVTGIRDMSTIATPPEERLPISTYVMERDDSVIREAILREIDRGGQVYFLHNEVRTIDREAIELSRLVPEASFLVAHGQMPANMLREHMERFTHGEADVLVCSTIIESGVDIPRVNTIIIDRSERLGLAQMYQLRGRVGRSSVRAYAYLMTEPYRSLNEVAQRRLATIMEADDLGAGFQIALKDLEIRGAGNLLGAQQSGHIGAVGFTLFTQLLGEAVERARARRSGRRPAGTRQGTRVNLDLAIPRYLPESYVDDMGLRMTLYQRLAAIDSPSEVEEFERELADRFGPLPQPGRNLLGAVKLKVLASRIGAESIQSEGERVVLRLAPGLS
ncbi:MAG: transcription-repair coupling factor, partial [Chloroflexi bacterium]|nr:transcription-repair coupling factor [Chloroflexota bacterium]